MNQQFNGQDPSSMQQHQTYQNQVYPNHQQANAIEDSQPMLSSRREEDPCS